MDIQRKEKAHHGKLTEADSTYHTRETYLQTLRQFMAKSSPQLKNNGEIEEYLLYEKRISCRIQQLLGDSDDEPT